MLAFADTGLPDTITMRRAFGVYKQDAYDEYLQEREERPHELRAMGVTTFDDMLRLGIEWMQLLQSSPNISRAALASFLIGSAAKKDDSVLDSFPSDVRDHAEKYLKWSEQLFSIAGYINDADDDNARRLREIVGQVREEGRTSEATTRLFQETGRMLESPETLCEEKLASSIVIMQAIERTLPRDPEIASKAQEMIAVERRDASMFLADNASPQLLPCYEATLKRVSNRLNAQAAAQPQPS